MTVWTHLPIDIFEAAESRDTDFDLKGGRKSQTRIAIVTGYTEPEEAAQAAVDLPSTPFPLVIAASMGKPTMVSFGQRDVRQGPGSLPVSEAIGEIVMEHLRQLDDVAYVRFASVYRKFEDVQAFREEIERLERDLPGLETLQLPLLESVPEKAKR
jgi:hypothetical protein